MHKVRPRPPPSHPHRVYDVRRRVEIGTLYQHSGTINAMAFFSTTHLISASDDSTLCLWRTKRWECIRVLKGHKGAVTDVAMHPSGRIAISSGVDCHLRTWDLVKGRLAFTDKALANAPEYLSWSPDGLSYAWTQGKLVAVHPVGGGEVAAAELPSAIHCIQFTSDSAIVMGCEDGGVRVRDSRGPVAELFKCSSRVRGVGSVSTDLMATACSDGTVSVWDVRHGEHPVASADTSERLTCLVIAKVEDDEEEEEPRRKRERK